jgi:Paraquat-inducible protein A
MKNGLSALRISFIVIVASVVAYMTYGIYQVESEKRQLKTDLIELSDVKYGMFNVDRWKEILVDVVIKKVEEFDITTGSREEMSEQISAFLEVTIDDFEKRYNEDSGGSFSGFLRKSVASMTDIFGRMKNDIPIFTEQIVDFMDNPENKGQIKKVLMAEIEKYTAETFADVDYRERDQILSKYEKANVEMAISGLENNVEQLKNESKTLKNVLYILAALAALFTIFMKGLTSYELITLTLISLFLLIGGLSLPMIDIDARIAEMNFTLMGESIHFDDQVLFFKSKSILEIVQLMMSQGQTDVLLVGLLVLLFSVAFPVIKLISSSLFIYSPKVRDNKFIKFMVFRSGKWSMADVMVVAIFMAFIGFKSILAEQMNQLGNITQSMDMLTTSNTELQTGFFLFTGFVILSLLISQRLGKLTKAEITESN